MSGMEDGMSFVSNVVLHIDHPSGDLSRELGQMGLGLIDYKLIPGAKAFENDLYAGAYNYLDIEVFVSQFMSLPWKLESAILSICTEGEFWEVYEVRRGRVSSKRLERD
jgi:hypothetical protein